MYNLLLKIYMFDLGAHKLNPQDVGKICSLCSASLWQPLFRGR